MIREQDEFAKTLSENRRLGEEFANAIVDTKIDPYDPLVHVRHALISVNLTAMKLVDGVAKLITKTDISSLANKDNLPKAQRANKFLEKARSSGRLWSRTLLLLNLLPL